MNTLRLLSQQNVSKFVRTPRGVEERKFSEIFVLLGTTPAEKHIPKSADFIWDAELCYWWTPSEQKARKLAQYAQNGLAQRWSNGSTATPVAQEPAIVGTHQQDDFWQAVLEEACHLVLEARAGCGKTFSVVEGARRARENKIGFSAFNASIAKELKEKVPPNARAFTLHALGYSAIRRRTRNTVIDEDGKKLPNIVEALMPGTSGKPDTTFIKAVCDIASLCKAYLQPGIPCAELDEIIARHEVSLEPSEIEQERREQERPDDVSPLVWRDRVAAEFKARVLALVPRVLEECKQQIGLVDFDDMIWLPVVLGLRVEAFDLLIIDEAQDMNLCQQKLAFMAAPHGRIIVVGDPRQSIYAFRGADIRSMARMEELLSASPRGCKKLPLTFTRRCPKSHVELVQAIVPDIEAMPEAPEGEILNVEEPKLAEMAQPGQMILCRTNAPLVGAALRLVRVGKKPLLRGRDLTSAIRTLIKRMQSTWEKDSANALSTFGVTELSQQVEKHKIKESARLMAAGKSATVITAVEDECDMVTTLCEGCHTLAQVDARIVEIFENKDESGAVTLSSVHGAKGLEAETVYILKPELMPHPNATRPDDLEQEMNIKYVAQTRSKSRLVFVHEKLPEEPEPDEQLTLETIEDASFRSALLAEVGYLPAHTLNSYAPTYEDQSESDGQTESSSEDEASIAPSDWRDDVLSLLEQAQQRTPFDAVEVTDAIGDALIALQKLRK